MKDLRPITIGSRTVYITELKNNETAYKLIITGRIATLITFKTF